MNISKIREAIDGIIFGKQILRDLNVLKSEKLTAEIGEWLIEQIYDGKRADSTNQQGYDLIVNDKKYQIKTHAKDDNNLTRWTEFKYDIGEFDYFVMSKELYLKEIYHIPEEIIFERINESLKKVKVKWDDYKDYSIPLNKLKHQEIVQYFLK